MLSPHKSRRRGFTFTEAAITLGIAGLILGAIWAAANEVSMSRQVTESLSDVMQINQNIRALYSRQNSFSDTNGFSVGADITENMIKAEIVPPALIDTNAPTTLLSRWGTPLQINVGGTLTTFEVEFADTLPNEACHRLTGKAIGPGRDKGLTEIIINGASYTDDALDDLTPTTLPDVCTNVTFVFNLKG